MTLPSQQHNQQNHHHHHRLFTCHRHPSKPITGFCAACLRERLASIDPDTHVEAPITHLAAELRRTKSYSSSSNPNASSFTTATSTATTTTTEPRRKSCDIVQARNTLSDLFDLDDKKRLNDSNRKLKRLELKEDEEIANGFEIGAFSERNEVGFEEEGEFKTMKEFIDLEWERKRNGVKDFRDIAGSFWDAASVFSKRLAKWHQRKHNNKKKEKELKHDGGGGRLVGIGTWRGRKLRETQSEIGEYGFGRRSCDIDPRLSVDVAQLSVDDSRYSLDEPRASWDGYLIGKTYPRLTPLVSVVEDVKDGKVDSNEVENLKEKAGLKAEKNERESDNNSPGGTVQTRDYYLERRRRRSFDHSGSNRRLGLVGDDELKSISNAKVSPETVGLFHGAKLLVTEKELRDSNWYSHKDYRAESVDSPSKDVGSITGGIGKKGFKFKKSHRWRSVLNVWGLMQRRSGSKCGDEESSIGGSVVDGSIGEPWQKFSVVADGEANGIVSQKLIRSYTVSARDSTKMASSVGGIETKENGMKRREELVLQRNRSARYSPNNLDNGLLRFYLTPLRSYGRSKSGKSRLKNSHSIGRNVL